jgi:hypothetical protein
MTLMRCPWRLVVTALAAGAIGLAAAPSPGVTPAASPLAPELVSIVLRMEVTGGLAPLHASLSSVPAFTLYSDGRMIFRSPDDRGDESAQPMLEAVVPSGVADAVVARALDRYGLREAREEYAVRGVADATTTAFTIDADGVAKTVSVYGLGIAEGRDRRELRRFERLASSLTDPQAWLPADVTVSDYLPERYRGVFLEEDPETTGLVPWPWEDLSPADLQPLDDAVAYSQADLTTGQVALVIDAAGGGRSAIAFASPDGQLAWRLFLRPLLPDEALLPVVEPAASAVPTAEPSPQTATADAYAYEDSA